MALLFCNSYRILKGFRNKVLGCEFTRYPGKMAKQISTSKRLCSFHILLEV